MDITNMVCNRLINKSGYSPIQRVLGYSPRVPGGLLTGGFNDLPTASRLHGGDQQVQVAQAMRLAAARAFHEADASQSLRNALHAGARPVRNFETGQLVYFWRKGADHAKKDRPYYWRGPARVILTALPSVVWLTYRGYVVKASPEHIRHANQEEQYTLSEWIDDIADTRRQINEIPRKGYIDLSNEEFPKDIVEAEQRRNPNTDYTTRPRGVEYNLEKNDQMNGSSLRRWEYYVDYIIKPERIYSLRQRRNRTGRFPYQRYSWKEGRLYIYHREPSPNIEMSGRTRTTRS